MLFQPLVQELRVTHGGVELIGREAEPLVQTLGRRIAVQHFQCQLAGAALARDRLDFGKQPRRNALAAVVGSDHHVVHVDEWLAGEGGKALDGVDEADRDVAVERQHAEDEGPRGEFGNQIVAGEITKRFAAARRVARLGIQQFEQRGGMRGVVVAGADDINHGVGQISAFAV